MTEKPQSVLLPNQRQKIIELLVEAGLSPNDFEWCDSESQLGNETNALLIKHVGGDYYFKVDRGRGSTWNIEYCPASETEWTHKSNEYWKNTTEHVHKWTERVVAELAAEDYVELATNNQRLLRLPEPDEEHAPFGKMEREEIIERLEDVESYLLGLRSDSAEYQIHVRASLEFLKTHAQRSDRRTLYSLVFSTVLAIGLAFLTKAETSQAINYATTQIVVDASVTTEVIVNNLSIESN